MSCEVLRMVHPFHYRHEISLRPSDLLEIDGHANRHMSSVLVTKTTDGQLIGDLPSKTCMSTTREDIKAGTCTTKRQEGLQMELRRKRGIEVRTKQDHEPRYRTPNLTRDRYEQNYVPAQYKKPALDGPGSIDMSKQLTFDEYSAYQLDSGTATNFLAIALEDYEPQNATELGLYRGDIVLVLTVHESGWWDGLIRQERGWFPSNYCSKFDVNAAVVEAAFLRCEPKPTRYDANGTDQNRHHETRRARVNDLPEPESQVLDTEEETSLWRTFNKLKALQKMSARRGSEAASQAELKPDLDFYSEGELSFVERYGNSGTTTPNATLSSSSKGVALDLASRILSDFIKHREKQNSTAVGLCQDGGTSERDSQTSSSVSSPSQTSAWSKDTTIMSLGSQKRRLGDSRETSDDDEEGLSGRPNNKKARPDTEGSIKLFACPFAKYDSERYSERNVTEREYRSCSSCLLRDIPRLKQHLYRVHKRPEHYCPSCFEAFKSRTLLDGHVRDRSCGLRESLYEEKMTIDQMKEIKRRSRGGSSVQHWFSIFKILFPGEPVPPSPYAGEGDATQTAIQHFVSFFRVYGPENFFNLIRDRQGTFSRLEASTQEIVDEAFEITAPELLRQLRTEKIETSLSSTAKRQEPVVTAAKSVATSLSAKLYNGELVGKQPTQFGLYDALQEGSSLWSAIPASPQAIPSDSFDCFDFDAAFDPLTVDDAFDSYGPWSN